MEEEELITDSPAPTSLDWYDFETKMRSVVLKLLEPQLNKSSEDRECIRKLRLSHKKNKKRIEELEFLLQKKSSKSAIMDEINQRITNVDVDRRLGEGRLQTLVDKM